MQRRTKVDGRHDHITRLVEAVLIGALAGGIGWMAAPVAGALLAPGTLATLFEPLVMAVTVLVLSTVQRHCRHWRWCFTSGTLCVAAMALAPAVFGYLAAATTPAQLIAVLLTGPALIIVIALTLGARSSAGVIKTPVPVVAGLAGALVITALMLEQGILSTTRLVLISGVVGGLAHLGVCKLKDIVLGRPLIQDGSRCPACGYIVLHLPDSRCPECGRHFQASELEVRPRDARRTRLRLVRSLGVVVAVGLMTYAIYPYLALFAVAHGPSARGGQLPTLRVSSERYDKALLHCLRLGDRRTRGFAADCLGRTDVSFPRAAAGLTQAAMQDPDARVRVSAIQSLGMLDASALDGLSDTLGKDPDPYVRWTYVAFVASGGEGVRPEGTPGLIRALDDPVPWVRNFAYARLCANTRQSFPYNPKAPRDER